MLPASMRCDCACDYSPERINPGDRQHQLPTITKITSSSTPEAADCGDLRFNLRSSNTEPSLRLNVESRATAP